MRVATVTGCIFLFAAGCSDPDPDVSGGSSSGDGTTAGTTQTAPDPSTTSTSTGISDESSSGENPGSTGDPEPASSSGAAESTGGEEATFAAGFDIVDISPNKGHLALNVYMGAYGAPFARGPAEGVHDPVFVRSFAVGVGEEGFVAGVADLPGFGNDFTAEIRARVAENTGLPPEHVLIGATHTHSAPDFMGLWGGGPSEYRDPVIDEVVGSLTRAWVLRTPATLEVSSATGPNGNRRDWEFTDDSITLLMARDLDGELMGSVGVFAAHPTVLGSSNLLISRDWCGGYVEAMEAHTGATSVLFNGVLGDASAARPPGKYADDFERAFAYGALIADLAYEASASADPISTGLVVESTTWTMPVQNALFQLAAAVGLLDYSFSGSGEGQSVDATATYVRLGEQLQIASFPGEPLTRTGLEVKSVMSTPHQAILGNTGPAFGYFILSDEWMTGRNDDYEETVSLHESAGDLAVGALMDLVELDAF
ncbi:MAG: hypothetical protein ACE37F_08395 [Nannocystaceae bacterium]|nr:hypothetical protein [bacterium]